MRAGHTFRTNSDTEVLLTGYAHWGAEVLQKLDGMFAFALYDKRTRTLFCARDPYGQKPFFYHVANGRLAFSSECRTFELLTGFHSAIDAASLVDFLAFESLPFDRSIYSGVKKLPPGHSLSWQDGKLLVAPYFESVPGVDVAAGDGPAHDADVHALLRQSVKRTFRADVPVGLLLSGGLDSSMVLAILREVHPSVPLKTFTIRNVEHSYDESALAAMLAKRFGTEHVVVTADRPALAAIASSLPSMLDEPQADPGILPKYMICGEIARTTKVALTGDGGDEFFYGYAPFRAQRLAGMVKLLPDALHRYGVRPLTQLLRASNRYMSFDLKAKQFAKGFPAPDYLRNFYWTCAFSRPDLALLLLERNQHFDDLTRQFGLLKARWGKVDTLGANGAGGSIGRLAYQYQQQYLPDYVLANSDRASMLNSVELRTPFLAVDLVRKLNSLPDSVKMRGGETKTLLRRLAARILPQEIAKGRKVGFTAPVASLVRNELKEEVMEFLGGPYLRRQGLFHEPYVARLLHEHFTGRHNHYKQIWVLFTLQKWLHGRKIQLP